jgi:hypothetical protein
MAENWKEKEITKINLNPIYLFTNEKEIKTNKENIKIKTEVKLSIKYLDLQIIQTIIGKNGNENINVVRLNLEECCELLYEIKYKILKEKGRFIFENLKYNK